MHQKTVLYLSTNAVWGGSEILWCESAKRLLNESAIIYAGAYFEQSIPEKYIGQKISFIDLRQRFILPKKLQRLLSRLHLKKNVETDRLKELLIVHPPDLAVLSLGNIKDGLPLMELLSTYEVPFVTIVHMVDESLWPGLDDKRIDDLNFLFEQARANFYVSRFTLKMHEKILGCTVANARIIFNPFTKQAVDTVDFPAINELYKVALIGRLENFHKGYDLLIDVVKQQKWRDRNICFSIFGKGPHRRLLKNMIEKYRIKNIFLNDHNEDVSDIWRHHHLLLMPSRMEGQSLSLIEAMKFKRAAVVTNVGGVDELIEDGISGFIAYYPTVEHIDIALERAWRARDSWREMGIAAFEHISSKHPEDAVGYFNDHLRQIIQHAIPSETSLKFTEIYV